MAATLSFVPTPSMLLTRSRSEAGSGYEKKPANAPIWLSTRGPNVARTLSRILLTDSSPLSRETPACR